MEGKKTIAVIQEIFALVDQVIKTVLHRLLVILDFLFAVFDRAGVDVVELVSNNE